MSALFNENELRNLDLARRRLEAMSFVVAGIDVSRAPQAPEDSAGRESLRGIGHARSPASSTILTEVTPQSPAASSAVADAVEEATCNVDHGKMRWATTAHCQTRRTHCVPIKEDSGTEVNWIAPEIVFGLDLEVVTVPGGTFHDFGGRLHQATKRVRITLKGHGPKTLSVECFLAPNGFPLPCVLLGSDFMSTIGSAQVLFPDRPAVNAALLMQQGEKTEAEKREIEARRAEMERRAAAQEAQRLEQRRKSNAGRGSSSDQHAQASHSTSRTPPTGSKAGMQTSGSTHK